ncbi:NmrA-like family protein [Aspergillus similis]
MTSIPPTILIIGATGNTGQAVTATLPALLKASSTLAHYRVLGLTRSLDTLIARHLSSLPGVAMQEENWPDITASWLQANRVVRAFIASHNGPNQFAHESTFLTAALEAGVQYVARISTTAPNVRPDSPVYYARTHWAIEQLLDSAQFKNLSWTSLQPNVFSSMYLASAVEFVKSHRATGEQGPLRLMADKDAPVGIIDAGDVGKVAAALLALDDEHLAAHSRKKYVLNGPEDTTGQEIVDMIEGYIGSQVKDVSYRDVSFVDTWYECIFERSGESRNVILSVKRAPETAWDGLCRASTTSEEVVRLAAPKRTPAEVLRDLIGK